jgi:ubiquinone biosynthesis protein
VRPFAERLVRERLSPVLAGRKALRTVRQAADLAQALPRRLDDLWDQLEEGEITVGVEIRRLEVVMNTANSMINRVVFALVVAALIIGSALILRAGEGAREFTLLGLSVPVAELSFVGAVVAAAWLLITMIRARHI